MRRLALTLAGAAAICATPVSAQTPQTIVFDPDTAETCLFASAAYYLIANGKSPNSAEAQTYLRRVDYWLGQLMLVLADDPIRDDAIGRELWTMETEYPKVGAAALTAEYGAAFADCEGKLMAKGIS